MSLQIRGKRRSYYPKLVRIRGRFNLYNGDNEKCHMDFVKDGGLTNLDSVIEAVELQDLGADISIATADTVTSENAEVNFSSICDSLDTTIMFNTVGTSGHDWLVNVIPHTSTGAGILVYEDTNEKVLTLMYETGVSTVTNFETAIGTTTNFSVSKAGTGANVLSAGHDDVYNEAPIGGVDTCNIIVTDTGTHRDVVINFEDGITTVSEVEAAIGALSGADAVIQVRDTGTGANILTAADDTLARTMLKDWKAPGQVGRGFVGIREADGEYFVRLTERVRSLISWSAALVHKTKAAYPCRCTVGSLSADGKEIKIKLRDETIGSWTETNYTTDNILGFRFDVLR